MLVKPHPVLMSFNRIILTAMTLIVLALGSGCQTGSWEFQARVKKDIQEEKAVADMPHLLSYNEAPNSAALSFADISSIKRTSEPVQSFDLRLGIIPVENPYWNIEDKFFRRPMDYSTYAGDLCEKLKEKVLSRGVFLNTIELPDVAKELAKNSQYSDICKQWGVNLVLTGVVLNEQGTLKLAFHSADGNELVANTFSNCWTVDSLCDEVIVAASKDASLLTYNAARKSESRAAGTLYQPLVTTAKVLLRCCYEESKGIGTYPNLNIGNNPDVAVLALASIIHSQVSVGPDAKGELVVLLDGKNVGGRLAPASFGSSKRRYEWEKEVAVRPGKHRLIIGGIDKGRTSSRFWNVFYADFNVADNQSRTITLTPSDNKIRWDIQIDPDGQR
jgi:hypothetical protein